MTLFNLTTSLKPYLHFSHIEGLGIQNVNVEKGTTQSIAIPDLLILIKLVIHIKFGNKPRVPAQKALTLEIFKFFRDFSSDN